jgi:hypothetical protein
VTIELDAEAIEMIEDFNHYRGDESYAIHLAYKIAELYGSQKTQT